MAPSDPPSRLREIRQMMGMSQRAIASDVGVSEATWQRMETGALPTGETLIGISKLGFNPTWVLIGEGPVRLGNDAGAAALPTSAEPRLLFRSVDIGRLDDAFREALSRCGLNPAELGDTSALMLLTMLLHDAAVKADQGRSQAAHLEEELEGRG